MFKQAKVTAISMKPKQWDKDSNSDKMESLMRIAAKHNPDLILTTEGVLEGYVITDVIKHPKKAETLLDLAEPIDGPYIDRFRRLARELNTCLCFGFAERVDRDVYNTAIVIDAKGEICGKYHKTQFAEGTHTKWNFNRIGKRLRAFDTPIGRVGIVICNDRFNPRIARTLVLDGARIILIPSYGSRGKEQNQAVLARARENGVPIVEANVGMNLIVSKGEIVAYKWGKDKITTAFIDIPEPPSISASRIWEREYLKLQKIEMKRRYEETMKLNNDKSSKFHLFPAKKGLKLEILKLLAKGDKNKYITPVTLTHLVELFPDSNKYVFQECTSLEAAGLVNIFNSMSGGMNFSCAITDVGKNYLSSIEQKT